MRPPADYRALPPSRTSVPREMLAAPRWVTWRLVEHRGRLTKRPDQSTLRAEQWLPADRAGSPVGSADAGAGFVLTGCVPVRVGVADGFLLMLDLDGCRDPETKRLSAWARGILDTYAPSYAEASPSGTGVHVFVAVRKLPRNVHATVRVPHAAPLGVDKTPSIQIFGLGPACYTTVTGARLRGTRAEIVLVDSLEPLLEEFEFHRGAGAEGDATLPEGHGSPPSETEVRRRVALAPHGSELLAGDWAAAVPADASASDAYFVLVQHVLRAAEGHGRLAVQCLMRTPWGRGQIDNSRDPMKYTREEWVAKDVARAAQKTVSARTLDVFPPVAGADDIDAPPPPPPSPARNKGDTPTSLLATLPHPFSADALEVEPPPREYLLRWPASLDARNRAGFAPMGVAGVLASEGGVGKTNLLLQLAVSTITGRPWLGFEVDAAHVGRRVLLVLAEETPREVERRLWTIGKMLDLTPAERALVRARMHVLPLAGKATPLAALDRDQQPRLTIHHTALMARLQDGGEPWGLVALDPLARLFPLAESQNELATFAVQAIEQIAQAPGEPLTLLAHHSSKVARRSGDVDARGVTGLTDGARWTLLLKACTDGTVELRQGKANYSPPMEDPLRLVRGDHGVLRVATAVEKRTTEKAETNEQLAVVVKHAHAMVEALHEHGVTRSVKLLAKRAGVRYADARVAVDYGIERGLILHLGEGRDRVYSAGETLTQGVEDDALFA